MSHQQTIEITTWPSWFQIEETDSVRNVNRGLLGNTRLFLPRSQTKFNLEKQTREFLSLWVNFTLQARRGKKRSIQRGVAAALDSAEFSVTSEKILTSQVVVALVKVLTVSPRQRRQPPWKLTHKGSSRLRVVAQRLKVCGESSGSVHSSGTGVRCGPLPFSQMYSATWNGGKWGQRSLEASLN